jgi:putative flippase GtrA
VNATTIGSRFQLARAFLLDIRSPQWGLAGQAFRFALAGGLVAVVYLSVTTVLHVAFAVPFQAALAAGFTVGVALHFTLQRVFVWRHDQRFALPVHHQALRYLCVCFTQYGITALFTSQLPDLLGVPVEVVYVATALGLAGINFIVFRGRVFQPG